MVFETEAELFRARLTETLELGSEAIADQAWKKGWDRCDDPLLHLLAAEGTKTSFDLESNALRNALSKFLLAEPDSGDREQAWKETEAVQTRMDKLLAEHRQKEDNFGEEVFSNERTTSPESSVEKHDELLDESNPDQALLSSIADSAGSPLNPTETTIVSQLLTDLNQSAILCDHVNVCLTTGENSVPGKSKLRLMLMSDYRISFCRSKEKINRPNVPITVYFLDIIQVEIDERFFILRLSLRNGEICYISCRSTVQIKCTMESLVKQLSLLLIGYPMEERASVCAPYTYTQDRTITRFEAIRNTFGALCDKSEVTLSEFLPYIFHCYESGKRIINIKVHRPRIYNLSKLIICESGYHWFNA
jgi:hypothetical protein